VNVWPPIVSVPVREAALVLAATLYVTVPLPVPLVPAVMEIHTALDVATQLQPALAVTATVPLVAADVVRSTETGEIVNVQFAPACDTVKLCPPIVIVPLRDVVPGFASTL
jgi:nucleoid-associated protein YgaU